VWVNWGEHPESLDPHDLHSGDFVAPLERFVGQALGVPLVFSQGDVGSAENSGDEAELLDDQGRVCGLLVLIAQPDALLLDNIAIAPDAQGRGFGRLLLAAAEHAARSAGLPVIRLYTNVAMTENIAIYSRHGYAETGRRVENGLHRVYMEKRL